VYASVLVVLAVDTNANANAPVYDRADVHVTVDVGRLSAVTGASR
jgi:hypothetical protein